MKNQTVNIETQKGPSQETILALMQQDLAGIRCDVNEIKIALKTDYVTKEQFEPVAKTFVTQSEFSIVKGLVFGFTTLILSAVAVAWIGIVVLKVKL